MSGADLNDPAVAADYDLVYADWDAQVERLVSVMNGHLPVVPGGRAPRRVIALAQMRGCLHDGDSLMVAIRDFSERAKSGVWRGDPVARVQARFAYRGGDRVVYAVDVEDAAGSRTHELEL